MKEDLLHYIWQFGLYATSELATVENDILYVVHPGTHNMNAGPDFLESTLVINNQKWVGNVEIHMNASDWYLHQHEKDPNYDAVILHVVWNHDVEVYMKGNQPLPTFELKNFVSQKLLKKYKTLFRADSRWIPCDNQIGSIPSFNLKLWLERLYFERLEQKTIAVQELLETSKNDWEAVLFQMLAKSFGSRVNGEAMLAVAESIEISVLRKEMHDPLRFSALLYGQAGLLEGQIEDTYYEQLREEYLYVKHKYGLKGVSKGQLQFFRMRPHNFPTVRIAQLVSLYTQKSHLFAAIVAAKELDEYYKLFDVQVSEYWKYHFNFGKESKPSPKKLTKAFIDLLIINTILPLKFQYLKSIGKLNDGEIIHVISKIKPERNSILDKFSELGIKAENVMESQALLELKNSYCASKRCLKCAIGKILLKE